MLEEKLYQAFPGKGTILIMMVKHRICDCLPNCSISVGQVPIEKQSTYL